MFEYSSNINNKLLEMQVEPLFKTTMTGGLGNIISAFLICYFLFDTQQQGNAIVLSTAIVVLSVIRILLSSDYLNKARQIKISNKAIRNYIRAHVFLTCVIGILWAGYALMQLNYTDEPLRNLVFLINFGLIAASIATLAYWMPAYLAYMVPQSIAILYVFIQLNMEHNIETAVAFVIFTIVMVTTSIRFNERNKREIDLLLKNELLIENLNQEVTFRKRAMDKNGTMYQSKKNA